jgi:hypothetical protein
VEKKLVGAEPDFFGRSSADLSDYKSADFSGSRLDCKIWTPVNHPISAGFETGFSASTEKHHYPVENTEA